MSERILAAVDDSQASEAALDYVGRLVGGRPEHFVHLVHVLPPGPLPGRATKHGGEEHTKWLADAKEKARELLERLSARLTSAGIEADKVDSGILAMHPDASMAEGLLDLARDQTCSTIVVGRNALPWHRELFHHHPADDLVRKAHGFTLWIVE